MRLVRPALALALLAALPAFLAACGKGEPTTPVACLEGGGAYEKALADAPGEVLIGGETPISDCLAERQGGGDLAQVGEALVETATRLDAEAREDPGGRANLELGYLLGAATAGAERTAGIHATLVRRLAVTAQFAPKGEPLSPEFERTYREGFDAGKANG